MDFTPRTQADIFLPDDAFEAGDVLMVTRLDGLDPLVMYGTGGFFGHSTVVHEFPDGSKHVCESTDANPFGKVYWPVSKNSNSFRCGFVVYYFIFD